MLSMPYYCRVLMMQSFYTAFFGLQSEHGILSDIGGKPRKSGCSLVDVFVDFSIQGEVVTYHGTQVCELGDNFHLLVVSCDGGLHFYILSKYISFFFQTDGGPKIFGCLGEALHKALEFLFSMCCDCSIISKEHVSNKGLVYFGSCCQLGQVEQLAICPSVEIDAFS